MLFPILQRRNPCLFFECFGKISLIIIANLLTDFRNGGVGIRKQGFCFFNPHVSYVFGKGKAGFLLQVVNKRRFQMLEVPFIKLLLSMAGWTILHRQLCTAIPHGYGRYENQWGIYGQSWAFRGHDILKAINVMASLFWMLYSFEMSSVMLSWLRTSRPPYIIRTTYTVSVSKSVM